MDMNEKNEMQGSCAGGDCSVAVGEAEKAQEQSAEQMPRRAYVPAVDLIDSDGEVVLIADIPGVPEGGVDLSIEKNVLTLTAVPADGVIAGKKLAYSEYGVGEYRRSFALSDEVDKDHISATLKDGVLRVHLPKQTPVTKKISVATA